jgi:ADP-ribose pyrophosphatase
VSGDAPGYPPALIRRALGSTADLVLGPSLDGGYCMIGMRRFHPAPFRDIAWSTGAVLDQTLTAARRSGLTVEVLEPHRDIDTIGDLLAADLREAPATRALLSSPEAAPFAPRRPPGIDGSRVELESAWRRLLVDELDDGSEYTYLETPRAVWVVPVSPAGETVFVRQYRHPVRAHPLEMPAGSIEPGESPAAAAARELLEEVGGVASELRRVGGFYSSSAHVSLEGLVFLATGVKFGEPSHARAEGIELVRMPFARAADLALRGELCEAQSALAIILAARAYREAGA